MSEPILSRLAAGVLAFCARRPDDPAAVEVLALAGDVELPAVELPAEVSSPTVPHVEATDEERPRYWWDRT